MTEYVSQTDTNKLIRKVLKESFPEIRFSVRKTGGGATDIRWLDGPNGRQVSDLLSAFEGAYFDGMIDYKGSRFSWLDGQEVHFLLDFIFVERELSPFRLVEIASRIRRKYRHQCDYLESHEPSQIVEDLKHGRLWNVQPCGGWDMSTSLQGEINGIAAKMTWYPFPQPSATLGRVQFKGSDGYGAGQPDRDGNGHGYGGYPRQYRDPQ